MKKVYLIRHGLPDFPGGERMCLGTTDIPMGEAGLRQAAEMASKLPPVTAVFSSPLTRAVQTAEAIAAPITLLPGLRELHMGQWDGMFFRDIREQYSELYAARGMDQALPLPGQEDPQQGLIRFQRALEEAARLSDGDFAVISHGGIIAHYLISLGGAWSKPGYAQIIPLVYQNGEWKQMEEENHA